MVSEENSERVCSLIPYETKPRPLKGTMKNYWLRRRYNWIAHALMRWNLDEVLPILRRLCANAMMLDNIEAVVGAGHVITNISVDSGRVSVEIRNILDLLDDPMLEVVVDIDDETGAVQRTPFKRALA